ncbi:MAG: Bacterial surface protein [Bacteroidetes bacterium]|nr:Bacterial surface protein [Bacteroidota bacterium]
MKRFATLSFILLVVSFLPVNRAAAQAVYTPLGVNSQGVAGYQFTGLPNDGDVQYEYVVSTVPPNMPFYNPDGTLTGYSSAHTFPAGGTALTVWIKPPAAGGTVTLIVKYFVADESIEIIRGDQTFGSTTPSLTLTFTNQPSPTTLGSILNSSSGGVKVTASNGTFTGDVTIALASNPTGATLNGTTTVAASAGVATFTGLWIDKVGSYTLKASATDYTDVTSNSFEIGAANTTTTINSPSTNASFVYGDAVNFSATVTVPGSSATPTGTVTFSDAGNPLGTADLTAGVATLSTTTLKVTLAPHEITAAYTPLIGNTDFNGSASAATLITITPKDLTVSGITADDKVYDGTTSATLNTTGAALVDLVSGDIVTVSTSGANGTFAGKEVGTNKTVTISGLTIGGTDAGNYTLTQPTATASITPASVSVTPADVTKALGASDPALTGILSGFIPSDNVTATYSRTPGETVAGSPYTISATLSPVDVLGNYNITYNTGRFFIIDMTPPELLVRFDVQTKDIVVLELGTLAPVEPQPQTTNPGKKQKNREDRTYRLTSPNGTWIEIVVEVKNEGHSCQAEIQSIEYSNAAKITPPDNELKVEWATNKLDALKELQQKVELKHGLQVKAKYDAKKDITKISIHQDGQKKEKNLTSPGVALIGMATDQGALRYDGPESETTVSSPSLAGREEQVALEQIEEIALPTEYALHNAYPNPFNPSATIRFDLPQAAKVRLAVYDMLGREVAVLADEERPAGQHSVRFDAGKLSSGMYIFRLQAGDASTGSARGFTQTKKLMLMK